MKITEIPIAGYEKVVRCDDPAHALTAFISIHDTTLGPALGGMRMWPYASDNEA
jgi:leucine dehydrogenase